MVLNKTVHVHKLGMLKVLVEEVVILKLKDSE